MLGREQTKSVESPITRIFGGKFRSTLRAPHQRDSVLVEDWRSLQLDIQVCRLSLQPLCPLFRLSSVHSYVR